MSLHLDRRTLIRAVAGTCAGLIVTPRLLAQQTGSGKQRDRPDPLSDTEVYEFVRVAHGNLESTRKMLDQEPRLIKATWDWGGGDFETALGGAGHMGRQDIAGFLLDRGAPLDLFVAAMMGMLPVVRAALEARPGLVHVPGPHGIPLIAHARAGKEPAAAVLAYVTEFEERHPE